MKYSETSRYPPQTMSGRGERPVSFLAATRPPQARTRGPASAAGCMRTAMTERSSGSRYRSTDVGGPLYASLTCLILPPAGSYVIPRFPIMTLRRQRPAQLQNPRTRPAAGANSRRQMSTLGQGHVTAIPRLLRYGPGCRRHNNPEDSGALIDTAGSRRYLTIDEAEQRKRSQGRVHSAGVPLSLSKDGSPPSSQARISALSAASISKSARSHRYRTALHHSSPNSLALRSPFRGSAPA
jgi:hypothetical protein